MMNLTRRTKANRDETAKLSDNSSQSNEQRKYQKKTNLARKTYFKKPNLLYPILSIVASCFLFAYIYFVLLHEDDLIPYNNVESPFFNNKEVDQRKWGTFRSGHYFALKTLAKRSPVFGLMWFENRVIDNNVHIRHWCDQSDRLTKYGWLKHDFHSFGIQEILDNDLNITTSFVIHNEDSSKSSRWSARVSIDFNEKTKNHMKALEKQVNSTRIKIQREISLIPYFALDSFNDESEQVWSEKNHNSLDEKRSSFSIKGRTLIFDQGFVLRTIVEKKQLIYSEALNTTLDPPLLNAKEQVMQNLYVTDHPDAPVSKEPNYLIVMRGDVKSRTRSNVNKKQATNLALRQFIVKVPTFIDFEFEESSQTQIDNRQAQQFTDLLNEKEQQFDSRFEEKFELIKKGYSNEIIQFAKAALSNMLGSVGSFYGFSEVSTKELNFSKSSDQKNIIKPEIYKYGPLKLLTAVPSRSFFPRGFLWDEGFHLLLLSKYDRNLSEIILSSWLNLMNRKGWIPREVILGDEARNRVPSEFLVQNLHVANPPTFFLLVNSLIENLNEVEFNKNRPYFDELYSKLVVWYDWYNRTQVGPQSGSYRWRGRNEAIRTELNVKTLSSGLDDYPRASSPNDREMHLDLLSWMTYATRILEKLSKSLKSSDHHRFQQYANQLTNEHIDNLHWSEEYRMYCDIGLHSRKVILKPERQMNKEIIKVRKELEPAKYGCVNEFGYVSLFPLLLQLIEPTNPRLGMMLEKLRDKNHLWSSYGLRSLSKNSSYYNVRNTDQDPPYWRSAIWINVNYLALKSLKYYSKQNGAYQDRAHQIFLELKTNLINNVFNEYAKRNYLFENYDDQTGQGKGCYPFTGWTGLIALIL